MGALQKLRKEWVAARMRATMITASEHRAKSLGANIPPRITTTPCSAPCWNLQSGVGCQALCFVSLLSKVCSESKDTIYWFSKCLHCWKSVKCWEGWTVEKKTRVVKQVAPVFTSLDTTNPFLAFEEKLDILHLSFGLLWIVIWMAVDEALP